MPAMVQADARAGEGRGAPGCHYNRPVSRLRLALACALLGLAACRGRGGVVIDKLDLRDLPVPAMVSKVATTVHDPYLVELPETAVRDGFDLTLHDVSLEEALEAIGRLDSEFRLETRKGVVALWPSGQTGDASPFARKVASFRASGGLGEVMRILLVESSLADSTNLSVDLQGLRRPVTLDMKDVSVRDALIELAAQAHVAVEMEPGRINVRAIQE